MVKWLTHDEERMTRIGFSVLRNLFALLAFAVLPIGWVLLSWVPDRIAVEIKTSTPGSVSLVANGHDVSSMELRPSHVFDPMVMYLPEECSFRDVSLRLTCDVTSVEFGKVVLRKFWLVDCVLDAPAVEVDKGEVGRYAINARGFDSFRLVHPLLWVPIAAGAVFLLAMAFVFASFKSGCRFQECLIPAVCTSALTAVLFMVVLPLQSYLVNRQLLDIPLLPLLGQMGLRFSVCCLTVAVCLTVLSRCVGLWVNVVMLALSFCVYLESGVLSMGLPELSGNFDFFDNLNRALID